MTVDLQNSVVLITSSDRNNSRFGTGFIIRRCRGSVYIVTCAHVVKDVGGMDLVKADDIPAKVIASGDKEGIDLAVLRVEGLGGKIPINLKPCGYKNQSFRTAGFQQLQGSSHLIRPLQGNLGEQIGLQSRLLRQRVYGWDLQITDNYPLQPGYSGSPVLDLSSGYVLGVVSHRLDEGNYGLAISIEALAGFWKAVESEELKCLLWGLGYRDQAFLFLQMLERESVAAFLIYGLPDYGQRWLLNRLVSQYVPASINGQVVKIHLNRRVRRIGVEALWNEMAEHLGLSSHSPDKIVEGVCRWWQTQDVLIVFHEVNYLTEQDFHSLIEQFWLPLAKRAKELQSLENPYKLLMFLMDYENCSSEWKLPFVEKLDVSWESHIPVRSPRISEFSDRDLMDWVQGAYQKLPSELTSKPSQVIQAILKKSDNGVPELALDEICDKFGYDWEEERGRWLKL